MDRAARGCDCTVFNLIRGCDGLIRCDWRPGLDGALVFCKCRQRQHPTPQGRPKMIAMFVNLPATDLDRAKAFYTAVGFRFNPAMSDHNSACIVVEEGHSYFMILTREYFQTFTEL